jgi:hypothetical protein
MDNKLVIKLVKDTENGNLVMWLTVTRNPVLDYMVQAQMAAEPYLIGGWRLVYAHIE